MSLVEPLAPASRWHALADRVLAGGEIDRAEARGILESSDVELLDLLAAAWRVRHRHFGTTVSEMLLDIRLAHLNARLKTARPGERIVDIAFDLGFTHLSRMASAYRAKFGESPKATLQRLS